MPPAAIRSALFVPASRPERIPKALASAADAVIVDLEDAVPASQKAAARASLASFVAATPSARLWVRCNAAGHPEHAADLEFCRRHAGVSGVMLAKVESAAQVSAAAVGGKPLWPLIESARGLYALPSIATAAGVERLAFGGLDLALDLGIASGTAAAEQLLDQARYALLLHSRLAGLAAPLDSVFPALQDPSGLAAAGRKARDLGFGGLLCIHPAQLAVVHEALAPSTTELAWARRVLAAARAGDGVFVVDGAMIDAPVIAQARRLLARAGDLG